MDLKNFEDCKDHFIFQLLDFMLIQFDFVAIIFTRLAFLALCGALNHRITYPIRVNVVEYYGYRGFNIPRGHKFYHYRFHLCESRVL